MYIKYCAPPNEIITPWLHSILIHFLLLISYSFDTNYSTTKCSGYLYETSTGFDKSIFELITRRLIMASVENCIQVINVGRCV